MRRVPISRGYDSSWWGVSHRHGLQETHWHTILLIQQFFSLGHYFKITWSKSVLISFPSLNVGKNRLLKVSLTYSPPNIYFKEVAYVCVCMYIRLCVHICYCMHVYACAHMLICVCMFVHICMFICVCIFMPVHMFMCVHMFVCVHLCTCMYVYVCVCLCVHILLCDTPPTCEVVTSCYTEVPLKGWELLFNISSYTLACLTMLILLLRNMTLGRLSNKWGNSILLFIKEQYTIKYLFYSLVFNSPIQDSST